MYKPKMFLLSLSLSLTSILFTLSIYNCPFCFADETLTITTYYPSPYGSYRQLAADQIAIGSTYRNPTYADGTLYVQGNVGIGTTGPGQKLEVVGNIKMSNGRSTIFTQGDNNTTHVGGFQFLTYDNGVDNVWTPTDQNGSTVNSSIRLGGFGNFNSNTVNLLVSGNVGIGTGGPNSKLDVQVTGTTTLINIQQTLSSNAISLNSGSYVSGNYMPGIMWNSTDQTKPKAGIWVYEDGSGSKIYFGTSNSYVTGITNSAMVIDPSGNVGIGTASPGAALSVTTSGAVAATITNTDTVNGYGLAIASEGTAATRYALTVRNIAGTNTYFHVSTETGRVGNVGIGTAAPAAGLEVNSAATDVVSFHNAVGTGLKLVGGGTTWTTISDIRLKDTLGSIKDATQKLLALHPVYYRLKIDKKNSSHRVGLIAQDVQKVFPEVVDVDSKGYLGLRYTELTPLLIAGFQEQESRIQKDEKDIEYLKQELIGSTAMLIETINTLKAQTKEIAGLGAATATNTTRLLDTTETLKAKLKEIEGLKAEIEKLKAK